MTSLISMSVRMTAGLFYLIGLILLIIALIALTVYYHRGERYSVWSEIVLIFGFGIFIIGILISTLALHRQFPGANDELGCSSDGSKKESEEGVGVREQLSKESPVA